jgi:diaminopimelate decarboxylase
MSSYAVKNGVLHCEDVPLTDLAAAVGTPCYVYSSASIKNQYQKLEAALQNALPQNQQPLLCYACKANSNLAVLKYLQSLGAGLEIVSEGELYRGLRAGFDPQKIVSTGVGKQKSEIKACLEAGILQINVESKPELEMIQKIASDIDVEATVVFRLNPDVSGGGHHKISTGRARDKFGMSADSVCEAYKMASSMSHINAVGLSMHIGSQVFEVGAFKKAFEKLTALVNNLRDQGYTVSNLDIGGGFPIQYEDEKLLNFDDYAAWVNEIIAPLDTKIIMEPGRYLVGNAGALLSEVLYIKETQDQSFLILDAAMNDLIRPTLYDAYHGICAVNNIEKSPKTYDVVGPVCETGDTFAHGRNLPEREQGDFVAIMSSGAYGACMSSNYNTRPFAPEIMVSGDQFSIIRARQTHDDILHKDIIPDWI